MVSFGSVSGTPIENREENNCPECGGTHLIREWERGDIVCTSCGLVVAQTLDTSPDWRTSPEKTKQTCRVGAPLTPLKPDYGLQTKIGGVSRDSFGSKIATSTQVRMQRLQQLNRRDKRSTIRNLRVALRELKRLCSQLNVPRPVAESAALYYRKALKKGLVRGRSIDGLTAAALYLAARDLGTTVTIRDIVQVTRVSQKELGRSVRVIMDELGIRANQTDSKALVQRFGTELDLSMLTQKKAVEIINQAIEQNLTIGKNPGSIAAATLYMACVQTGERRTQLQIAEVANTTPVTIRNRFKELKTQLNIEKIEIKRGVAAIPVYWPSYLPKA